MHNNQSSVNAWLKDLDVLNVLLSALAYCGRSLKMLNMFF
jgi:hypothetical protein